MRVYKRVVVSQCFSHHRLHHKTTHTALGPPSSTNHVSLSGIQQTPLINHQQFLEPCVDRSGTMRISVFYGSNLERRILPFGCQFLFVSRFCVGEIPSCRRGRHCLNSFAELHLRVDWHSGPQARCPACSTSPIISGRAGCRYRQTVD